MNNIDDNMSSIDMNGSREDECDSPEEVDSILDDALDSSDRNLNYINEISERQNDSYELETEQYIRKANADVLLKTLAPEVTANEQKKREHKDRLIKYVSIFLGVQFVFVFLIIIAAIAAIICFHALDKPLSQSIVNILFAFFGTYITSIIVELVYILKYIVVNVFDTSISALTKAFANKRDEKEQES